MQRKDILEGWGSRFNRYADNFNSSKAKFKRDELEAELGHEVQPERQRRTGSYNPPVAPKGMYFYNVKPGQEGDAIKLGLKQTQSGKWKSTYKNSAADTVFGPGRYWEPKSEAVREMTPAGVPVQGKVSGEDPSKGTVKIRAPNGTETEVNKDAITTKPGKPNELTVNNPKIAKTLSPGTTVTMTAEDLGRIKELAGLNENTGLPIIKAKDLINNIAANEPEAAAHIGKIVVATPDGNVDIKQTLRKMSGEFIRMFPDLIELFEDLVLHASNFINTPDFKMLPRSDQQAIVAFSMMGPDIEKLWADSLDVAKQHDSLWNQDTGHYPQP